MGTHAVLLYPTAVGGLNTVCVPQPLLERFKVWGITGRLGPDGWRWGCDSVVLHPAAPQYSEGSKRVVTLLSCSVMTHSFSPALDL